MVVGVVVAVAAFYGGMKYAQSKVSVRGQVNLGGQTFGGGARGGRTGSSFGGIANGEIISKDDKSITVKLVDGGSKIIFLSANTKVSKQIAGSASDLVTGTQVSAMGAANADGSVNASSVQIRPNMPPAATVVQ